MENRAGNTAFCPRLVEVPGAHGRDRRVALHPRRASELEIISMARAGESGGLDEKVTWSSPSVCRHPVVLSCPVPSRPPFHARGWVGAVGGGRRRGRGGGTVAGRWSLAAHGSHSCRASNPPCARCHLSRARHPGTRHLGISQRQRSSERPRHGGSGTRTRGGGRALHLCPPARCSPPAHRPRALAARCPLPAACLSQGACRARGSVLAAYCTCNKTLQFTPMHQVQYNTTEYNAAQSPRGLGFGAPSSGRDQAPGLWTLGLAVGGGRWAVGSGQRAMVNGPEHGKA